MSDLCQLFQIDKQNLFKQIVQLFRLIQVFAGLLIVTLTGCRSKPAGDQAVDIDDSNYNFGNIEQFTEKQHSFKINNKRSEPVEIVDINKTCGCTDVEVSGSSINPGKAVFLITKVNPGRRIGLFGSQVVVSWRGAKTCVSGSISLGLRAKALALFTMEPPYFDFGEVEFNDGPVARKIVLSRGEAKVDWDSVKCQAHDTIVSVTKLSNDQFEVEAELNPSAFPIGTVNDRVQVKFYLKGVEVKTRERYSIPLQAEVIGNVHAIPKSIYLGVISQPGVYGGGFTIENGDGKDIALRSIVSGSPSVLSAKLVQQSLGKLYFKYEISINNTEGNIYTKLLVRTKGINEEQIAIPIIGYFKPVNYNNSKQ